MPALNAIKSQFNAIKKPLNGSIGALTVNMGKIYNTASNLGMSLPYLQEARSGLMKVYTNTQTPESTVDPAEMAKRVAQAMRAAEDAQYRAQAGVNNFNGGVKFSGVKHSWNTSTGNPIYQGGLARAQVGADIFDLPNAVAQQAQYQAAYNQGRWDPAEMFGQRELKNMQPGMNANFDVAKQKLSRFNLDNPQLFVEGSIDPYQNAQEKQQKAYQELQNAQKAMGNFTETLDNTGRAVGFDVAAQRRNDLARAERNLNLANQNLGGLGYMDRGRGQMAASQMMQRASRFVEENVKPTVSNLQIKETLIK